MAQTGTRPSSTISGLIEAGFRLWEIGYRDFNKALRSVVNNPRVVLSGIPNGFFDDFLAGATKYDAAATPGSRHRRPPTSRGAIAAADTHLPDGTVLKAGEHKIFIKGDVTYYLDKDGYPTAAVGYLNPPSDYKKSGVGHRPYPVGWIDDVDDRGHMIPEAGVRSKRDVNLDENLFSQQKTANGSPKKVWENAIIAYAKAHPGVMAQVTVLERYSSGRPKKAVYSLYDLSGNEIPGFRVTINNPRTLSKPPTTVPSSPIYPTP